MPEQPPPILVGALADAAAIDRAAEIGDGFLDTLNAGAVKYAEALGRAGKDPAAGRVYALQWAVIDEDPERAWAEIDEHFVDQLARSSARECSAHRTSQQLRPVPATGRAGFVQLWDASAAIDQLSNLAPGTARVQDLHFWGHLPGEPVEAATGGWSTWPREVCPRCRPDRPDGPPITPTAPPVRDPTSETEVKTR